MTRPDPPGVCTCDALPAGHDDDQCAMEAWRARCKCSHGRTVHSRRTGQCWQHPCACREYREGQPVAAMPARFDERYDPSPEPIDRKTR